MTTINPIQKAERLFIPSPNRWTCEQFHNMGDAGVLEGHPVMLINGVILEKSYAKPQEVLYYQHGGILPYVLRQLLAK